MSSLHQPATYPRDPAEGREPRHLARAGAARRTKALLGTIPLVIVSTIAMSVGLATPANAATPTKKLDRTKTTATVARAQGQRGTVPPRLTEAAPRSYAVVAGDTVSMIAGRYGLSTASVLAANGLSWSSLIFPGQVLALADAGAPQPAVAPSRVPIFRYTIVSGDTISGIAASHSLRTQTVLAANGLDPSSVIFPGQSIVLPDAGVRLDAKPDDEITPATASASVRIIPLTDEMRANAAVIVEVGRSEGVGDYGLVIALAAAMQESGLRNLPAGDGDSVGLFQQRPSMGWGTPEQILDPVIAARSFFGGTNNPHPGLTSGLLDVDLWESMSVSQAAQAAQRSENPDSYAQWEDSARAWALQLG